MDNNIILLIINALLYLSAFIYFRKKENGIGAGSAIILYYFLIAFSSIQLFIHPLSQGVFMDLTLFPFIYLFFMLITSCYPVIKYSRMDIQNIELRNYAVLDILCYIIIFFSILYFPKVFQDFSAGLNILLNTTSGGAELYLGTIDKFDEAGRGIANIPAIFIGAFSDLSILFFFFYLTLKKKNKKIMIGLIFSVVLLMMSTISLGLRGQLITTMVTIFFTFLLMNQYLTKKIKKTVQYAIVVFGLIVLIPVLLITFSRFTQANFEENFATYSFGYYFAQAPIYFNNYALDAGGCRYGDRTAVLFKSLIAPDVPMNYAERMEKYSYMNMQENIFSTYIGDLVLDYGPIFTVFLVVGCSLFILRKTKIRKPKTILFHQLILVYLVMCISVQGAFTLFTFSDVGGNLRLIVIILVYLFFLIDYYVQTKTIVL